MQTRARHTAAPEAAVTAGAPEPEVAFVAEAPAPPAAYNSGEWGYHRIGQPGPSNGPDSDWGSESDSVSSIAYPRSQADWPPDDDSASGYGTEDDDGDSDHDSLSYASSRATTEDSDEADHPPPEDVARSWRAECEAAHDEALELVWDSAWDDQPGPEPALPPHPFSSADFQALHASLVAELPHHCRAEDLDTWVSLLGPWQLLAKRAQLLQTLVVMDHWVELRHADGALLAAAVAFAGVEELTLCVPAEGINGGPHNRFSALTSAGLAMLGAGLAAATKLRRLILKVADYNESAARRRTACMLRRS